MVGVCNQPKGFGLEENFTWIVSAVGVSVLSILEVCIPDTGFAG